MFMKLRVLFDTLVCRRALLLESRHHIESHLDVVVEIIELYISFPFKLHFDEEFIEFW